MLKHLYLLRPLHSKLKAHLPAPVFDRLRKIYRPLIQAYLYGNPRCLLDAHRKLIYVILPKNACSSIKASFHEQEFTDDPSLIHNMALSHEPHITREDQPLHVLVDAADYFKFTFVRNPFARLYSCYMDKRVHDQNYVHYLFGYLHRERVGSFTEFVKRVCRVPDAFAERHFMSQYHTLFKLHGVSKAPLDFIGRYESLAEDFAPIREKYGLKPLAHFNRSQGRPDEWMAHYSRQTADLVYRRYRRDFALWYPHAYESLLSHLQTSHSPCPPHRGGGVRLSDTP